MTGLQRPDEITSYDKRNAGGARLEEMRVGSEIAPTE